jgi:hypothetical protein
MNSHVLLRATVRSRACRQAALRVRMEPETSDFDGCVIGQSIPDPTLMNRLRVWQAWISRGAALSDDQGTTTPWHIDRVTCSATDIDRIRSQPETVALVRPLLVRE